MKKENKKENLIKDNFNNILDINEQIKQSSGYYQKIKIPVIRSGKEKQLFKIDDICLTVGSGTYPKNLKCKILTVENNNGYYRYMVEYQKGNKSLERQKDLTTEKLNLMIQFLK